MQVNHRAEWLELLQQAFAGPDADGDGVVRLPERAAGARWLTSCRSTRSTRRCR
jgi:hypothetical protein